MPSIEDIKNWMLTNIAKPVMDTYNSAPIQNTMTALDPIGSTLGRYITEKDAESQAAFNKSFKAHYPGAEDAKQAMIPTKENIALFLQKMMKSDVPASIVKKYPDLGTALSIAEARYPNQMAQAKIGGPIRIEPKAFQGYGGYFQPDKKQITVVAHPVGNKVEDAYYMMKNYLKTTMHEAAHADQFNRKSSKFDPNELRVQSQQHPQGSYITPEESVARMGGNDLYRNQPVEVDAFRRGAVAEDVIGELADLLPAEVIKERFSGQSTNLQHDMQRLASYFNKAIKLAANSTDDPRLNQLRVEDLVKRRETGLARIKVYGERTADKNPGQPYQSQFDLTNDRFGTTFIDPEIQNRISLTPQSQNDLKMNSLIRKVQDAKGVGPMQEWLRKTLETEAKYAPKEMQIELLNQMRRVKVPK